MFNIAFDFSNIYNETLSNLSHRIALGTSAGESLINPLSDSPPVESSKSDSNNESLKENFEIGLFVPQSGMITPAESTSHWNLNESFSGYKNYVAELNPRPPKLS